MKLHSVSSNRPARDALKHQIWDTPLSANLSLGFETEYVVKGDTSAIKVDAININNIQERNRVHAEIVAYGRRDYLEPLQIVLSYRL
ncbi:MAG TPA: hypothetical protein VE954_24285 [Oligoflexus sp.]|uniref:hypothetical protein n=1 Tax=Oligoflexus sp. TaxID=1971216 RepID=UPI002D68EF52|nr:hypothetical protein [Oligoflexus sp.]HYX36234.1 hypothetical protein [Oligoflexus sp.]